MLTQTELTTLISAVVPLLVMATKYLGQLYIAKRRQNAAQKGK